VTHDEPRIKRPIKKRTDSDRQREKEEGSERQTQRDGWRGMLGLAGA